MTPPTVPAGVSRRERPIPAPDRRHEPALVVEDARRRFDRGDGVAALDGLDLAVPTGSITAVLGPSGCGKTTLLRTVAGTERLDGGLITIGGVVVADSRPRPGRRGRVSVPPERRRIGLVPQEGALFPHLDVAGNVAFGVRSLSRAERSARVAELLDLVGLASHGSRRPHELSGGERQRVALARALAPDPDVVLLDEPFSALDAALRTGLRDQVAELLRRSGSTAVIVTHDRVEAMAIADQVAVMRDGRIVQSGPPEEIYRRPVDEWTGRFLGAAVTLAGVVGAGVVGAGVTGSGEVEPTVSCSLGELALDGQAPGRTVTVFVRPEQIVRVPDGVAARVRSVRFLGPDVVIGADLHDGTAVTARWPSSQEPAVDDEVRLAVVGPVRAFARGSRDSSGTPGDRI